MRCSKIGIVLVRSDAPRCTSIRVGNDYKSILCNKSYCTPPALPLMLHHGPTGVVIQSNNVVLCCINARCFLLYAGNFLSHIFPLFGISILPKNPYINLIEVCQAYTYQLGFFTRTCINFP